MTILILHRGSLRANPYDEWLRDYAGDLILVVSREDLKTFGEDVPGAGTGYRHVEAVSGYETTGRVEAVALDLARAHKARFIISCRERDLERAAVLRAILGLGGQSVSSAVAFRDKIVMKELVSSAGIPVAPYATVQCAVDVRSFAARHGYPVVLKPRNGSGSIGIWLIDGPGSLSAAVTGGLGLSETYQPNHLVESFIHGEMYQVNGLRIDGRTICVWPSRYLNDLFRFNEGQSRIDVTLDGGDPLTGQLTRFTEDVLAALPTPRSCAFHAEVFRDRDGCLILCEIASRTGGALVKHMMETVFGFDPTEWWVRAEAGLPLPPLAGPLPRMPARMAGQLLVMKSPGRVVRLPAGLPVPGVRYYRRFAQVGQVLDAPEFSGDLLAGAIISAPDRATCELRLERARTWIDRQVVIEPAAGQGASSGPR